MPVHKVPGGYKWGNHGKVYKDRAGAERQARAAYANGYRGMERGGLVETGAPMPHMLGRETLPHVPSLKPAFMRRRFG